MPKKTKIPDNAPLKLQPINDMSVSGLVVTAKKQLKNKKYSYKFRRNSKITYLTEI